MVTSDLVESCRQCWNQILSTFHCVWESSCVKLESLLKSISIIENVMTAKAERMLKKAVLSLLHFLKFSNFTSSKKVQLFDQLEIIVRSNFLHRYSKAPVIRTVQNYRFYFSRFFVWI